ncbi:hypothetical protein E4P38_08175 [Blastococcus sp. CT_GayMR16]|nr:hypothetical protein E4P38_08175 [Blastococcus sp. CT_GayMR16]
MAPDRAFCADSDRTAGTAPRPAFPDKGTSPDEAGPAPRTAAGSRGRAARRLRRRRRRRPGLPRSGRAGGRRS